MLKMSNHPCTCSRSLNCEFQPIYTAKCATYVLRMLQMFTLRKHKLHIGLTLLTYVSLHMSHNYVKRIKKTPVCFTSVLKLMFYILLRMINRCYFLSICLIYVWLTKCYIVHDAFICLIYELHIKIMYYFMCYVLKSTHLYVLRNELILFRFNYL